MAQPKMPIILLELLKFVGRQMKCILEDGSQKDVCVALLVTTHKKCPLIFAVVC